MPWINGKWKQPKPSGKGQSKGGGGTRAAANLLAETLSTLMNGGKGKGKGKGKQHAGTVAMKPGEWVCKNHICEWAIKGRPNPPSAKRCGNTACCLDKASAMNPPANQRVQPAEPSFSHKTAQAWATAAAMKEKSAAAAKAKEATAAESATTTAATEARAGSITETTASALSSAAADLRTPHKVSSKPLKFNEQHLEEFAELAPSLQTLVRSLAAELLPPPLDLPSAKETAEKWLGDSKPGTRASEKVELEKSILRLRSAVAPLEPDEGIDLRAKLASQESTLAKLSKEPSSTACQLAGVVEATSKFERSVEERKARRELAKAKTLERKTKREAFLQTLADQLEALRRTTQELEDDLTTKHEARATQHEQRETDVRVILGARRKLLEDKREEEKREAAKAHTAATQSGPDAAMPQQEASRADPAMAQLQQLQRDLQQQLKNAAEQAAAQQKAHAEQMAQLQARLDGQALHMQQAAAAAKLRAERQEAYEVTHEIDTDALPALQAPQGEQLAKQGQMLYLLREWKKGGASAPVLFQDLIAYSELANDAPLFVRTALGSAWSKWFASDCPAQTVVPRQALDLVLMSLEKLKLQWENQQATEHAASGSYALLAGVVKKRRAEAQEEAMPAAQQA